MNIFYDFEEFTLPSQPIALTIGTFDGVHRGHQFLFQQMSPIEGIDCHRCALTFRNHPSEVLKPDDSVELICTLEHKIELLKKACLDSTIVLSFTKEFAEQKAEDFIRAIRKHIPFSYLFLGHDATLGKNRHGDKEIIQQIAKELNFKVYYSHEYLENGIPISSTSIRKSIREGDLPKIEKFLGRPYSIFSSIQSGNGMGEKIGFPTINLDTNRLCLPPLGVYQVTFKINDTSFAAIANLGLAPSIKNLKKPVLEAYLLSGKQTLLKSEAEVIFHHFIRSEKKFNSIEELQVQIEKDIAIAKSLC